MDSSALVNLVNNEKRLYDSVVFAVKHLRSTLDRAAEQQAKANAKWHDDPTSEDHAAYHAPANVQFPRPTRDKAIRDLVAYYLAELK